MGLPVDSTSLHLLRRTAAGKMMAAPEEVARNSTHHHRRWVMKVEEDSLARMEAAEMVAEGMELAAVVVRKLVGKDCRRKSTLCRISDLSPLL